MRRRSGSRVRQLCAQRARRSGRDIETWRQSGRSHFGGSRCCHRGNRSARRRERRGRYRSHMPRRKRSRGDRLGLGFCPGNRQSQPAAIGIEWTADFGRYFNLALDPAASDQSGIKLGQDIGQGQTNQNAIAIVLWCEDVRGGLAQLTKRNFHGSARKLREDFFQRHGDCQIADIRTTDPRLQFQGQSLNDRLEADLNTLGVTIDGRRIAAQRRGLKDRRFGSRGGQRWRSRLGSVFFVVLRRCLRRLAQQVF